MKTVFQLAIAMLLKHSFAPVIFPLLTPACFSLAQLWA